MISLGGWRTLAFIYIEKLIKNKSLTYYIYVYKYLDDNHRLVKYFATKSIFSVHNNSISELIPFALRPFFLTNNLLIFVCSFSFSVLKCSNKNNKTLTIYFFKNEQQQN